MFWGAGNLEGLAVTTYQQFCPLRQIDSVSDCVTGWETLKYGEAKAAGLAWPKKTWLMSHKRNLVDWAAQTHGKERKASNIRNNLVPCYPATTKVFTVDQNSASGLNAGRCGVPALLTCAEVGSCIVFSRLEPNRVDCAIKKVNIVRYYNPS